LLLCLPPLSRQVCLQGSCILRVLLPTQLRGGGLPRRSRSRRRRAPTITRRGRRGRACAVVSSATRQPCEC
jgi:hypothetical protein